MFCPNLGAGAGNVESWIRKGGLIPAGGAFNNDLERRAESPGLQ